MAQYKQGQGRPIRRRDLVAGLPPKWEARLQVRRRRRKKVPLADRQPLARPQVYISWANSEGAVIAYAQARVSRVLVERFML